MLQSLAHQQIGTHLVLFFRIVLGNISHALEGLDCPLKILEGQVDSTDVL